MNSDHTYVTKKKINSFMLTIRPNKTLCVQIKFHSFVLIYSWSKHVCVCMYIYGVQYTLSCGYCRFHEKKRVLLVIHVGGFIHGFTPFNDWSVLNLLSMMMMIEKKNFIHWSVLNLLSSDWRKMGLLYYSCRRKLRTPGWPLGIWMTSWNLTSWNLDDLLEFDLDPSHDPIWAT